MKHIWWIGMLQCFLVVPCAQLAAAQDAKDCARKLLDDQKRAGEPTCVLTLARDNTLRVAEDQQLFTASADSTCAVIAPTKSAAQDMPSNVKLSNIHWDNQIATPGGRCQGLFLRNLKVQMGTGTPPPALAPAPARVAVDVKDFVEQRQLKELIELADKQTETPAEGTAKAGEPAIELITILGEIVLARGSQAALTLAQERILSALQCDAEKNTKGLPEFVQTCAVIRSASIEDLAVQVELLKSAVLADLLAHALKQAPKVPPDVRALVEHAATRVTFDGSRGGMRDLDSVTVDSVTGELIAVGHTQAGLLPSPGTTEPAAGAARAGAALAIASAALAACELQATAAAPLADCRIDAHVRTMVTSLAKPNDWVLTRQLALRLAGQLLIARTARTTAAAVDPTRRAHAAVDAVFEFACESVGECTDPTLGKPAAAGANGLKVGEYLALYRVIIHAAIDRDGAAVIEGGLRFVAATATSELQKSSQRSARLLVRLVHVGEAYVKAEDKEGKTQRDARKELIESLADDFADRSGRAGDTIVALGGSLRLVGGRRWIDDHEDTWMGPIGLTLGLSVTHLARDSSCPGAFVELGFIDLGQYVSFEGGGKLREPRPDDILSPWLTAGLAWGIQNPFFIAVTAGVSPTFRVSDGNDDASDDEVAGSFNLGLTTGVHVPLLDLN